MNPFLRTTFCESKSPYKEERSQRRVMKFSNVSGGKLGRQPLKDRIRIMALLGHLDSGPNNTGD